MTDCPSSVEMSLPGARDGHGDHGSQEPTSLRSDQSNQLIANEHERATIGRAIFSSSTRMRRIGPVSREERWPIPPSAKPVSSVVMFVVEHRSIAITTQPLQTCRVSVGPRETALVA